jgi:protein gp37
MLTRTNIGWADYSGGDLNVVIRGKSCPISEGCAHCYVERWFKRYRKGRMPEHTTLYDNKLRRLRTVQFNPGDKPYRRGPGSKPIMFVADFGDLFCEDVPFGFAFNVLNTIYPRDDADWVLLTKRPARMGAVVAAFCNTSGLKQLPAHIWCMASVENQKRANERIPLLLAVKAQVLGLSVEPMLDPIDLTRLTHAGIHYNALSYDPRHLVQVYPRARLDWIIAGAESGEDRRPFEVAWAADLYRQCKQNSEPFFFGKQDSGLQPGVPLLIEGREIKEFPRRLE